MKQIFLAVLAVALTVTQPSLADDIEIEADSDFYVGQVLFEHEACAVKYVVAAPAVDHLYINGVLAAVVDYGGEVGTATGSHTIGLLLFEFRAGVNGYVSDYLDTVLQEHLKPRYAELDDHACLIA